MGRAPGRTGKPVCPLRHGVKDFKNKVIGQTRSLVMNSVVGAGITLSFDVEPHPPGESEYAAGKLLLKRAVSHVRACLADHVVVDGKFATAPFLHTADAAGVPTLARRKDNWPELAEAVEDRFGTQPPGDRFSHGEDWI